MNHRNLYAFAYYMDYGYQIFKSVDGGDQWTSLGIDAKAIAIDPLVPQTVYVAGRWGLDKSTDGGINHAV